MASWLGLGVRLAGRGIRRPRTGLALVRVLWRFRRRDWYRRFPFVPLPDRTYLRFRMYTAYGDENAVPPAGDIENYARWAVRSGPE